MDVDARACVGVLAHDAGDERHPGAVEGVGQAVHGDGQETGIAHDDLHRRARGRVALVGRADVLLQRGADFRQGVQQLGRGGLAARAAVAAVGALVVRALVGEGAPGLVGQLHGGLAELAAQRLLGALMGHGFVPVAAREEQRYQVLENLDDGLLTGQVDLALRVGHGAVAAGRELPGQRFETRFNPFLHLEDPWARPRRGRSVR